MVTVYIIIPMYYIDKSIYFYKVLVNYLPIIKYNFPCKCVGDQIGKSTLTVRQTDVSRHNGA